MKELCRRQLLAKTSAANDKSLSQLPVSGAGSPAAPATPTFSVVASPLASPLAQSPAAAACLQRNHSFVVDERACLPVTVEPVQPPESTVSSRPALAAWHMPASSVNDSMHVNRSPRPTSNSSTSADGAASHQFAMVSRIHLRSQIVLENVATK